eukprot:Gb_17940 [translate_table: standard]
MNRPYSSEEHPLCDCYWLYKLSRPYSRDCWPFKSVGHIYCSRPNSEQAASFCVQAVHTVQQVRIAGSYKPNRVHRNRGLNNEQTVQICAPRTQCASCIYDSRPYRLFGIRLVSGANSKAVA